MTHVLFVQPHLDDIALSCGGIAAQRAARGDAVRMVTVFCGAPPPGEPLHPFAEKLHQQWGAEPVETLWAQRRAQDTEAARVLGVEAVWLRHLDAVYREYADNMGQPLRPKDTALLRAIETELVGLLGAATEVFLPLGVGGHPDHRLVMLLGPPLAARGLSVHYYEDYPYTLLPGRLEQRLAACEQELQISFVPTVIDVTNELATRVAAIEAYGSQIDHLFRPDGWFPGVWRDRLHAYASGLSPSAGRFGERLWHPRT